MIIKQKESKLSLIQRFRKTQELSKFWRTKKLSVRASYFLAKANIANEQKLIEKFTTLDSLIALRNCGRKTAEEIWTFITNLNLASNCDQGSEIKSSNLNDEHSTEAQSVFIPLLNIKVSVHTWEVLQKIPINNIQWSIRTQNILLVQGFKTIAEIAELSPKQWLKFKNFRRKSLIEIQETVNKIIENPDMLNPDDEHSALDPNHSVKLQWFFIPLLNIKVSGQTWTALQKTPVNSIQWSVRTRNVIKQQGLQQLADLCQFSSREWLSFRNFGSTSLTELQKHLTETVKHFEANSDMLDPDDEHSAPSPEHPTKAPPVFIPLLNIKVSGQTWTALQNRSIHQLTWSVRTKNILLAQDFKTLAEIAELSPKQWLKFRNFGRKSLTEIQETVKKITTNPDVLDPKAEHSVEVSQIQTLNELGHVVFQRLQIRQQEVVKYYYGYNGTPKNLQQIGEVLGITRERVRQIKKTVNNKLNQGADNYLITTTIFRLLSKSIRDILSQYSGFCSVEKLQEIIYQRLGWENSEQWIINWFNEAFGEAWICSGADDYKIVDGVCHLKTRESFQDSLTQLASRLQHYGYRPLALEECQNLIQKMAGAVYNRDSSSIAFDSGRLLDVITSYPSLKVYRYGKTHVGLKAWTWFTPEKPMTAAGQAALIEWYLRMTNEPATAKEIANGIGSQLGNFRLTSFDVADICEKHPYRFQVDDNGAYGLHLWEESSKYRQDLTELLSDEPLSIEQIVEVLSAQEPADTLLIVAALNFSDSFVETVPFEWVLKPQTGTIKTEDDFDYTKLTFEDLIPKL